MDIVVNPAIVIDDVEGLVGVSKINYDNPIRVKGKAEGLFELSNRKMVKWGGFTLDTIFNEMTTTKTSNFGGMKIELLADMRSRLKPVNYSGVTVPRRKKTEYLPTWDLGFAIQGFALPPVNRSGVLEGVVKVQGAPQPHTLVHLYFRKTGKKIMSVHTDQDGNFIFNRGLNKNVSDYFVVATTEQAYNAQVFDKLKPT